MVTRNDSASTSPLLFNLLKPNSTLQEAQTDSKPKVPRRIDPDRLAIRLGPELTAEMDAYIVPGAKMPSFEIRQGFVKKYNVDRRHIYDYFHSRGLRVAKEDKHLNLSHRMSRKPAAARKPAVLKAVSSDKVKPVESATVSDPSPSEVPPTTVAAKPRKSPSKPVVVSEPSSPEPIPSPPRALPAKLTKTTSKRRVAASRPAPAPPASPMHVSPLPPSLESMDLSSDSSDSEAGSSPIFDFVDTFAGSSSFGEDLSLLSLGYSVSDDNLHQSFGPDFAPFPPALLDDDLLSELDELQREMPQICNQSASVRDSLLPLDGLSRLSEYDRMEYYNLVNAGIGPAQGIEECAGTYKAHMERLYFNRSYPGAQPRPYYHHDNPCYSTTPAVVPTRPPTMIEKENINHQLSTSRTVNSQPSNNRYYRQSALPSSALRPSNSRVNPSQRETPTTPFLPASTAHLVKPFVLPSAGNPEKITTPPVTNPMPHERATPLIWMSPITYSASASSQPRTQAQMSQVPQVLARSHPFAIPTFYTPSGEIVSYTQS
ncbi:hypothetical protein MVEN_01503800 [Mycena venus]|uniref:Uncharacterized protein n=1 Tax=Mycena venus TaxID=2733690 RepID=A0A8H6XVS5_9AGAR|nr:hypothetical protein MVEN_01503800 [Mycena venus]